MELCKLSPNHTQAHLKCEYAEQVFKNFTFLRSICAVCPSARLFMIDFDFLSKMRFAPEYPCRPGRSRNATCDFPAAPEVRGDPGNAWNLLLRKAPPHRAAIPGYPHPHTACALSEQFPAHLWWGLCLPLLGGITAWAGCRCDRNSPGARAVPCRQGWHPPKSHPQLCASPLRENGICPRREAGYQGKVFTGRG